MDIDKREPHATRGTWVCHIVEDMRNNLIFKFSGLLASRDSLQHEIPWIKGMKLFL
jgi:hypothetical protein